MKHDGYPQVIYLRSKNVCGWYTVFCSKNIGVIACIVER